MRTNMLQIVALERLKSSQDSNDGSSELLSDIIPLSVGVFAQW